MAKLTPLAPHLDRVRAVFSDHLPWSPHDYVPGISRKGDRALYAEELTRPIAIEDDLRFLDTTSEGLELALLAERLPWDSQFFGHGIAKLHGIFPLTPPLHRAFEELRKPLKRLLKEAQNRGIRYLFIHADPRDLALLRAMGELGFVLIETRSFHHGPVNEPQLTERFPIRRAVLADIPSLTKTAEEMVNPYDRFHADPFIRREDADRLMRAWVEQSILGRFADVTIVPDMPNPTAFVTYRYHQDKWDRWGVRLVQGVLSAVAPDSMGWMGKLGPEVNHHLRGIGAEHSFGSTQVTNRSILWFAEEAGARFGRCEHIFRVIL